MVFRSNFKNLQILTASLCILYHSTAQATENEYNFQLVGTIEAGVEESRALIETPGKPAGIYCAMSHACRSEKCTCTLGAIRIASIGREYIWVLNGRTRVKVRMGNPVPTHTDAMSAVQAAHPSPPPGHTQFWRTLMREIERAKIVRSAEVLAMRQQKARLVADMLFGSMGLKPGDTIVKIQGFTFEPSSSWGAIADLLKSQDKIFIETQRTGKSMLFEIQVRE